MLIHNVKLGPKFLFHSPALAEQQQKNHKEKNYKSITNWFSHRCSHKETKEHSAHTEAEYTLKPKRQERFEL